MSICPTCHKASPRADFCEDCFVALAPAPGGRFLALLAQDMVEPAAPRAGPGAGPDLLSVSYRPTSWYSRVLIPGCKKALLAAAVLATVGAGWLTHHHRQQKLAGQSALDHLTQCGVLRTKSDIAGANREGQLALEQADLSGDRALLAQTRFTLGDLSASQSFWDEAVAHYQTALELGSSQPQLNQKLTLAKQRMDRGGRAQAMASLTTARQQISQRAYIPALKSCAEAQRLFQLYHGTQPELAECQYVNGLVFDKMGLTQECLDHLRQALAANPHHRQAGALLARLTAPPPRPRPASAPEPVTRPAAPAEILSPRLESGASYPTYQRPSRDDDEPEDRLSSARDNSRSYHSQSKPRPNPGYPTYQPPRRKDLDR